MTYQAKTKDEILSQQLLANVSFDNCQALKDGHFKATHVVIGVTYGGSMDLHFITVSKKHPHVKNFVQGMKIYC